MPERTYASAASCPHECSFVAANDCFLPKFAIFSCPLLAGKRPFAGPGCINLSLLCHLNGIVSSIPR